MSRAQKKSKILVTGCARSGTAYLAAVLGLTGIPCGHEQLFNYRTTRLPDWGPWTADSSWCGVPWVDRLPPDVLVVHVVRHPLRWLASHALTGFTPRRSGSPSVKYATRHTGIAWSKLIEKNAVDASMYFWVRWNLIVSRGRRVRLEDVDGRLVAELLTAVGAPTERVRRALDIVPKNLNTRPHRELSWSECRKLPHAAAFAELGRQYGYGEAFEEQR